MKTEKADGKARSILLAILAAALYGISAPFSKLLLAEIPPAMMAALLYLGAGIGMLLVQAFRRTVRKARVEARLTRRDLPYVAAMVILDVTAPICLMLALTLTTAASASLLNNFEIVATALIALLAFREPVGRQMWASIALITLASMILSIEDASSLALSRGSLLVLLACLCWGLENNCTRMLSLKDPLQIVTIKGVGSGAGALLIAAATGQLGGRPAPMVLAMLLGFVAYGLSIHFYILAQRRLGAARTSAYYAIAPFIGVLLSILIFGQRLNRQFGIAALVMAAGAALAVAERHRHRHMHPAFGHEHRHTHPDAHHTHSHPDAFQGEHTHYHEHEAMEHTHAHTPDMHHRHRH